MLTQRQRQLIRSTFSDLQDVSLVFALTFYQRLFELDPPLRSLFHTDIEEQSGKLMQTFRMLVDSLDAPDDLRPAIESLGRRHVTYGVREEHYKTVGEALLWALQAVLGNSFSPEARAAWGELYGYVAGTMKRAARSSSGSRFSHG